MALRRNKTASLLCVLFALLGFGCSNAPEGRGAEEEVPPDGKLDSFRAPTQHGHLVFGASESADLTEDARFHTWEFQLSDDARVKIDVDGHGPRGGRVDTVAYLYKRGTNGTFGSYLHRADDAPAGEDGSVLEVDLERGTYRILAKAYAASARGTLAAELGCISGACDEASVEKVERCIFPAGFDDFQRSERFVMRDHVEINAESDLGEYSDERSYLLSTAAALGLPNEDPQAALAALGGALRCAPLMDMGEGRTYSEYAVCAGEQGTGAIVDDTGEFFAKLELGRNDEALIANCTATESMPAASCRDVVASLVELCDPTTEELGFVGCANNLYPGTNALNYAMGCCSGDNTPDGCDQIVGSYDVQVRPATAVHGLNEEVVEFGIAGVEPFQREALPRAVLARLYSAVARHIFTTCRAIPAAAGSQPTLITREALYSSLEAEVDNEETEYHNGPLSRDEVDAVKGYLDRIDDDVFGGYTQSFGDPNCESWGRTEIVIDGARGQMLAITRTGGA